MAYHDALMSQLKTLVKVVRTLRSRLKDVDKDAIKVRIIKCRTSCYFSSKTILSDNYSLITALLGGMQVEPQIEQFQLDPGEAVHDATREERSTNHSTLVGRQRIFGGAGFNRHLLRHNEQGIARNHLLQILHQPIKRGN